jgi:hypothetical protein
MCLAPRFHGKSLQILAIGCNGELYALPILFGDKGRAYYDPPLDG